jgi:alkanesulfonate monooxygenase SsuD/methylene tetrahydromethanopterin reductase-like flavin-dependent oxidoreductase (luciferase family)
LPLGDQLASYPLGGAAATPAAPTEDSDARNSSGSETRDDETPEVSDEEEELMSKPAHETGLLLPSRESLLWGDSDLAFVIDAARQAEAAGYDSVWAGDSLLARPRGEPLALLAAVAGATTRVTLGTAVLLPLLRHPLSLAHSLATLDRVARGRVIVGVGPGAELPGTHAELAALGVPGDRRVGALLNTVERCRRLWRDEEPGIELRPRPFRPGGPPIWLGGSGPRMLRLAGTTFDGWLPFSPTATEYASGLRAVRDAAEGAGRDPGSVATGAYLTVAVADTPGRAAGDLDAYMRAYYGVPAEVMTRQQACHAGTLESAAEWFGEYRAAGADHLVVRLARPDLSDYNDTVRRLLGAARSKP